MENVWTCSFRETEKRWVWYLDNKPKITVSFDECTVKENFNLTQFGIKIANTLKTNNINKIAKNLNALVLENPYIRVHCRYCNKEENYTIDDLVDSNGDPKYNGNFVFCINCNKLIILDK